MIPIARAFMPRILSIGGAVSQARPQGPLTVGDPFEHVPVMLAT
jgi:hypothetical protein